VLPQTADIVRIKIKMHLRNFFSQKKAAKNFTAKIKYINGPWQSGAVVFVSGTEDQEFESSIYVGFWKLCIATLFIYGLIL
jgi:hypothetical protein